VALARKVLCILYHLLIHQEIYHDDPFGKPRKIKHIDEMIKTIIKAGYELRKKEYSEGG
jgi:hypothetical protein